MKIIFSPAKNMKQDDFFIKETTPVFLQQSEILLKELRKLDLKQLQKLWQVSDKLLEENYQRLKNFDFDRCNSPAIFSYDGIAYQHLCASVATDEQLAYLKDNLRILSGFYGLLSPMDGIMPYRLEMQAKLKADGKENLYDFWGSRIADKLYEDDDLIVNLASQEYSKVIAPFVSENRRMITIHFFQNKNGKLVQQSTFVKAARGEMVRYFAENQIEGIQDILPFNYAGLSYDLSLSDENNYVFVTK